MSKYRKKETYVSTIVHNELEEIVRQALPDSVVVQVRKWYGWVTVKCFPVDIEHEWNVRLPAPLEPGTAVKLHRRCALHALRS